MLDKSRDLLQAMTRQAQLRRGDDSNFLLRPDWFKKRVFAEMPFLAMKTMEVRISSAADRSLSVKR
jgi:hypothetical protein